MASSESKTPDKLKTVFVISPIGKTDAEGNDFAKLCLEQIIKPAAKDCGGYAVPERADEHHKPGSVTAKVVTAILDADVCVADLTERNANVMYEVAIAHAADKPVILLQQEPGGPPFDFADERVIHYGLRVDQANAARNELVGHFRAAQHEDEDPRLAATMNPVRVLFGQLKAAAVASEPEKAVLAELQAVRAEIQRLLVHTSPTRSSSASISHTDPWAEAEVEAKLINTVEELHSLRRMDRQTKETFDTRLGLCSLAEKLSLLDQLRALREPSLSAPIALAVSSQVVQNMTAP